MAALPAIPLGNEHASEYHNLIIGAVEFPFFPELIYPWKEHEIHEGRKRIDIVLENSARSGAFADIAIVLSSLIRPHTCFLNAKTTVARWVIQRSTSCQADSRVSGEGWASCAVEDSRTGRNSSSGAAIRFGMIAG
jgi:hypothetical protein